ncbi:MAG TPA: DUF917 domain-containing protein [Thermomicrobiaceae bacterium]|nr:DUF917 domain-containing protein [Thermomicrobiaceae bacterium]
MPNLILDNDNDIADFVHGLTFMGTGGGGGSPAPAIELMRADREQSGPFQIVDIDDLPADAWTVAVAGLGGRPPEQGPSEEELHALGLIEPRYGRFELLAAAVQELARYAGVDIRAIVPGELGSANTPAPMIVGRRLGIPTVDGDYAGRAIPEIGQTVPDILGRQTCPFSFVDRWGNVVIVKEAASPAMIDRIGRMLCLAGYGGVSFAGFLAQAGDVRDAFVRGTLSRAVQIGRAGRQAPADRVAAAMAEAAGGWVLFTGTIERSERDDQAAYMFGYGTHVIRGAGDDDGHELRVWYKNEHHLSWIDGQPFVTSPDCLAIVDLDRREALPNSVIQPGQRVAVVGWPGNPVHRSPRGVAVLGPRHFGFDVDFVPIEDHVGRGRPRRGTPAAPERRIGDMSAERMQGE